MPDIAAPRGVGPSRALRRSYDVMTTLLSIVIAMVGALALVISIATHHARYGQYTVLGHPVLVVLSGSMSPAIRTGDLIVDSRVNAAQAASLGVGQIATFATAPGSTTYITHRIIRVVHGADGAVGYVTKGDANPSADTPPRAASLVVGVFDHKIPRGGYLLDSLHRPLVLALLVASPLLWFASGPLLAYGRKADDDEGAAT
jgi:signal peptidase